MGRKGWIIPPPVEPVKSLEEFRAERERKVAWLVNQGYLKSERIRQAMLRVRSEEFIPRLYRDYAYEEVPLPLPGEEATISCPHSYPLFYEALGLDGGHRFLEIGIGSGYGAALAREIVGASGLVVSMEIDPSTLSFAAGNLRNSGYRDVLAIRGDGALGYPPESPYDRICLTAACDGIPSPLWPQLETGGRLIAPVREGGVQNLVLFEKGPEGISRERITEVLYISMREGNSGA